jgi:hypothetical protein
MKWYNVKFLDYYSKIICFDLFYCINEDHVRTEFNFRHPLCLIKSIEEVE